MSAMSIELLNVPVMTRIPSSLDEWIKDHQTRTGAKTKAAAVLDLLKIAQSLVDRPPTEREAVITEEVDRLGLMLGGLVQAVEDHLERIESRYPAHAIVWRHGVAKRLDQAGEESGRAHGFATLRDVLDRMEQES